MTMSRSMRSIEPNSFENYVRVVIGIIKNTKHEVLVTKRQRDVYLGGLLEFPGGKLKVGETPQAALRRELKEELNINLHRCVPLIQIPYSYPDRNVLLDVYSVINYSGSVAANEAQNIYWKKIAMLNSAEFPSANFGIIRALQLPTLISVTPDFSQHPDNFFQCFENVVTNKDVSIIHLRSHELNEMQYMQLAQKCLMLCKQHHTKLILNRDAECLNELKAEGLHLTSRKLLAISKRPLADDYLVSASCHNTEEIRHASKLELDYIFLGPVMEKNMATKIDPMGWDKFKELAEESLIPVYAIGGLAINNVYTATQHGGQGIAAIRDLWVHKKES